MARYQNWIGFAALSLGRTPPPDEITIRRSISALYYAMFHRLSQAGSALFQTGGNALAAQVARSFSHSLMRRVCEAYDRNGARPKPLDTLVTTTPHPALRTVAATFIALQEARERADYDLTPAATAALTHQHGLELLERSSYAHWQLDAVLGTPEAATFLAALLLHDKWTRRG